MTDFSELHAEAEKRTENYLKKVAEMSVTEIQEASCIADNVEIELWDRMVSERPCSLETKLNLLRKIRALDEYVKYCEQLPSMLKEMKEEMKE